LEATKGSQKWIQKLINEKPELITSLIIDDLGLPKDEKIDWVSPKKEDDYAEYRDEAFLEKLGIDQNIKLADFWPSGGPQWDALGKSIASKRVFLVEAKSHIPELISTIQATNPNSISKICECLQKTKDNFGCKTDFDWSKTFYQYANRLAHVSFLNKNNVPAYLVGVYFVNDLDMNGPKTAEEWKGAIRLLHRCLGIRKHLLKNLVADLFIDVQNLI